MKQRNLFFTAVFMLSTFLFAKADDPKIKLTFGPEYELPKKHFDLGFIGNTKDGFIQIGHAYGKDLSLQKFSPALKLVSEKQVDLKAMPKGYDSEQFTEWNGKYYWFFTTWEKKENKERLFVQEVDLNKGDLTGSAKELIGCKKVTGDLMMTGIYQFHKGNKFKLSFSTDSTKMFVYVKYPNELRDDSKNYEEYGFWVFDNSFKIIWSKPSMKMPYTEKKMDVFDTQGDREGNFLFLAKVYNDDTKKEIRDDAPNFHFEILKFSADSKTATSIPFKFEDKYVSQLTLLEDLQGKIVCCGFYSGKDKNGKLKAIGSKVDGSFFLRLDTKDNKLVNVHKGFYEIPSEIFKQYESERTVKKMEKKEEKGEDASAFNMRLRNVVFNEDGSLLLLGEEYYLIVTTIYNGRTSYTTYHYFYNDILAQYIDPSGNLTWTKKIPKAQTGTNSTYGLGFRVLPYNGSSYLFFLDNLKNLNIQPNQAPEVHSAGWGGVLMGIKLDATGNMQKTKIFDTREVNTRIDILNADRVGPNTLIDRVQEGANMSGFAGLRNMNKPSKICLITIQ